MKSAIPSKTRLSVTALVSLLAFIVAAASFTGCLFSNSSEETEGGLGVETRSKAYFVSDNRIITPESDITDRYCVGDSMHTEVYRDSADTVEFGISDGVLSILNPAVTFRDAVLQWISLYARSGSGSGLEGSWTFSGRDYRVVSGTLTAEEKAGFDEERDYRGPLFGLTRVTLVFGGGRIRTYRDRQYAKAFILYWNGADLEEGREADSAVYDIEVKELDKFTVELKGRKSGETVRLKQTYDGKTYTSDKAGHAPYEYFADPKTCPTNEDQPDWYVEFLEGNRNQ